MVTLELGMLGIAIEPIALGEQGQVFMYNLKETVKVRAKEDIRLHREVFIVDLPNYAMEHTPEELKYMTIGEVWQRVSEAYPLPVTRGRPYYDYKEQAFTASETSYVIGKAAHEADPTYYPADGFMAYRLEITPNQDCYIRLGGDTAKRVRIPLVADVEREFFVKCNRIWVVRKTADGTLKIYAEGGKR